MKISRTSYNDLFFHFIISVDTKGIKQKVVSSTLPLHPQRCPPRYPCESKDLLPMQSKIQPTVPSPPHARTLKSGTSWKKFSLKRGSRHADGLQFNRVGHPLQAVYHTALPVLLYITADLMHLLC